MYAYSTTEATACWSENTNSSVITSHKKTERRKKNKNATGVRQQQDATVRASRASVALSEARADTKTLPCIAYQYTAVVIIVLVDNVEPTVRQYLVLCFTAKMIPHYSSNPKQFVPENVGAAVRREILWHAAWVVKTRRCCFSAVTVPAAAVVMSEVRLWSRNRQA